MILAEVTVPLLNANEPEARLVSVHVQEGQAVEKGALLFTIETTKAAADIESPASGFVRLLARPGDTLAVGARLAVITSLADEPIAAAEAPASAPQATALRITQPARALAEALGVDLNTLPTDRLITEEVLRGLIGQPLSEFELPPADKPYLLVYGGGGHARSLIEMVNAIGQFALAGIVDDKIPAGERVLGVPVLGGRAVLPAVRARGVSLAANGVGGILDIQVRVRIFSLLEEHGFDLPRLVHPRATVEPSAVIGAGVQVFANAYVGSQAILHPRCMVNTGAIVSHDCEIGAYTHIAPGALLAGHVQVGERTLIGMGVTTAVGIRIGSAVRVGNGAILLADVPDGIIVQAGRFWTGKAADPRPA